MIRPSQLTKDDYSTGEVAKMTNLNPRTPYHWCKRGDVQYFNRPDGDYRIPRDEVIRILKERHILGEDLPRQDVIYCRVSTHGQAKQGDLDRQMALNIQLAASYELYQPIIIKDIASGLNTKRKGLKKIIDLARDRKLGRVFVSGKDRLTRFGFDYLKWLFEICEAEVIVLEEDGMKEPQQELVDDLMALLASFSGKLYSLRRKEKAAMKKKLDSIPEYEDEEAGGREDSDVLCNRRQT